MMKILNKLKSKLQSTMSAADLHWPEMIQAVAVQFGKKLTQKDVQKNEH